MLSPSEFVQQWGTTNVFRFPSDLVDAIDIPKDVKTFLSEAGLPCIASVMPGVHCAVLPVETDSDLVPGSKHPLLTPSPFGTSDCFMLARLVLDNYEWTDCSFAINKQVLYLALEISSGQVRLIGPPIRNIYEPEFFDETSDELFNSSVSQMAEFLLSARKFEAHYKFRWCYAPYQVKPLIDALEQRLWKIDPLMMEAADGWWPKNIRNLRQLHQYRMKIFHGQSTSEG